ncbi:MAG: fused MFS/spermidine synthase [Pseudomonadota bacterium]
MTREPTTSTLVLTALLFFVSGAAALVYEVLWMKELSLLFGNSAQAAAATLAAFFTGIAAGNAFWGRRASRLTRPLFIYGALEIGVTLSALLYFAIYAIYDGLYPTLFAAFGLNSSLFSLTKFALALVLFFPAAFFMGGTLPVMTQFLVRNKSTLGKRASTLYALNTIGAAIGALAAGFYLPQSLGLDQSYMLAMTATLFVGLLAMACGRQVSITDDVEAAETSEIVVGDKKAILPYSWLRLLAGFSGFASLALQVLWIRMFAQVLHNSVYTYAAILSIFLVALALGGGIARELARRHVSSVRLLILLLTLTGLLIAVSPTVFHALTNGGSYVGGSENFSAYIFHIMGITAVTIGVPTTVIGILLPYLFKLAETGKLGPGETVGSLVTINTVGAIAGSVVAGFLLLEWAGMWFGIKLIACLYLVMAIGLVIRGTQQLWVIKLSPIIALVLVLTVLDTSKLPVVKIDPIGKNETLLKVWEGADATVAVVRRNGHLRTKMNNWYTLGSTGDTLTQQAQTHLPMQLHPNPKSVFYLGMGTGITAGSALDYNIEEVIVSELSPSAIRASKEYFTDYTNGLYEDSRVTVITEDGRNVLRGSQSTYDLIISDLFIPWKAGTGTLYSVEHYTTARKRLSAGGMYAQWLPLYQLTRKEFAIIAKSMLEVFPTVSIWRGNFWGERAVVALIGHKDKAQLEPDAPILRTSTHALRQSLGSSEQTVPLMAHFAGAMDANDPVLKDVPANTDNFPVIEYLAPINHRQEKAGEVEWFLGEQMFEFVAPRVSRQALLAEPYLQKLDPNWYEVVQAGYYLQASYVLKDREHEDAAAALTTHQSLLKRAANLLGQ